MSGATLFHGAALPAGKAWSGPEVAHLPEARVKLRWTDQPYRWHVNSGQEVFVVLAGRVEMHLREAGEERVIPLGAGDVLYLAEGTEHVAHPQGPACLLVVE
ncbi:cupin domain-containing protein [Roseomonas sp. GC11]|uniref:cupin domain-containing protein n=1 Tax=Roseomonas sp. GC11 TaxID=2950546 RepID=UPI00210ACA72|nr:cupin domain-containing protein [Roseomonas sp. GC11]MCQ4159609.1 cupin domain-containing protein [Roseomonas sp. GC11]